MTQHLMVAYDTTSHACGSDSNSLIIRLEHHVLLAIKWFENNNMKVIEDIYYLLLSKRKYENISVKLG